MSRALVALSLILVLCAAVSGCGKAAATSGEPEAKERLKCLLELYRHYVLANGKGPANEQELRAYGQKLTPQDRTAFMIGDDLENIFVSPRDNQKFQVRYGLKLEPTGATRAVAWEATPQNGKRYVALTMLYVEEYDEETFKSYNH
ncbi:MAG TPA: hypothetical protein VFB80_05135 [Pirellulaceae bacterium]|nr:hypothetical protein [Pirellulaceae bacterium]